jgi:hypothetical protein
LLFFHFKYWWDGMANSTANVRVETGAFGFFAKGRHFDTPLEGRRQRAGHFAAQVHELTGVRPTDGRDWASATQVAPPGGAEQTALFTVAAAIVVAVKVFTFCTSRCSHISSVQRPAGLP